MSDNRGDFIAPPWWLTPSDDYTKSRSGISTTYTGTNNIIGRRDTIKYKPVTTDTVICTTQSGNLLAS